MEAGFGAVEVDLAVVSHPDFADRSNRNQRSTEGFDAVGEAIDGAIVYGLEDVEVAGATNSYFDIGSLNTSGCTR